MRAVAAYIERHSNFGSIFKEILRALENFQNFWLEFCII